MDGNGYERRMLRVLDHVHDNLDGDLSLDRLADVAAMSRFHWHRVFTAMMGETAAQAIRRIRLSRSACLLVQTDQPLTAIAQACGYPNLQSFTRVFGAAYGLPPAGFRTRGELLPAQFETRTGAPPMYPVKIETRPATRLMAVPHEGAYIEIGSAFERLSAIAASRGLFGSVLGMVGVYYDDPDAVAEADLRSHAGFAVAEDFQIPDDLGEVLIPAGKTAVMTYKGPYAGLHAAYKYLYGPWLAENGSELRDGPPSEIYLNNPRDTAPEDLLTEVCVPLK